MALTNFASLTDPQKAVWSKDIWKTVRQTSFFMNIATTGPMGAVHRVSELTSSEKGARAYLTLVADLNSDGVTGDHLLWDNEEAAYARQIAIDIDQLRNAVRNRGRMTDQKAVVTFREQSRDLLGYWMADHIDQIACHVVSGWPIQQKLNGAARPGFIYNTSTDVLDRIAEGATGYVPFGRSLADLEFFLNDRAVVTGAATNIKDLKPTDKRHFRWDANLGLVPPSNTSEFAVSNMRLEDTPTYEMFVMLKAYAKDRRIRPIKLSNGVEVYHVFIHPAAMAKLKLDASFLANLRNAGVRGESNPLFSGSVMTLDGLMFHEITHMPTTIGASALTSAGVEGDPSFKWGSHAVNPGGIDGSRITLVGAQGLAMADIGPVSYEEDTWDFMNQNAISVGKMFGFLRPKFFSPIDAGVGDMTTSSPAILQEDYGTISVNVAL